MARLSEEEKRELLSAGPSLSADLAKIKRRAGSPFHKSDGTVDYAVLLGHPRKPFRPIEGDRFLL